MKNDKMLAHILTAAALFGSSRVENYPDLSSNYEPGSRDREYRKKRDARKRIARASRKRNRK